MIDMNDVLTTVRSPLKGIGDLAENDFIWENEDASPGAGDGLRIEERFTPTDESAIGSQYDRLTAECRYTVTMPRGGGTSDGLALATQIKQLFPNGSSIVGPVTVVVDRAQVLPGRNKDENRFAIPVSITIRVEALREN